MPLSTTARRLLAALLAVPLLITFSPAHAQADPARPAATAEPLRAEPVDHPLVLAELGFSTGVDVVFTLGERSGDYGLAETGEIGRNGPLVPDREHLLAAYLEVTPREVPVPEQLLGAWPAGVPYPEELAHRRITPGPVRATDLAAPSHAAASQVTCWSLYYNGYHWYEPAGYPNPTTKVHQARTYYSSQFGGMAYRARSYVANCGSFPVAHRLYYRFFGEYIQQFSNAVPAWHWQAVRRGSAHTYRKVEYAWGSGYTRNGRFG